jgi:hypothetical protein
MTTISMRQQYLESGIYLRVPTDFTLQDTAPITHWLGGRLAQQSV